MANLYYDVRIDIQKDTVIDSGIRFTQGDSKVIYLKIMVMNGGSVFDDSNTTPSICFVKPDGKYVVGTPTKSGNYWVYQILGNELQAAGKVLCDVKFTYESGRVSSSKFTFNVEKDTTISSAEASTSYIAPMQELLGEMENYRNQGYSMATSAQSWATGGTGSRTDEDVDNAKYYYEHARAVSGVDIATTSTAGLVKPDGTSITIDSADGTIHAQNITIDSELSDTSTNPVQNKVVTSALDGKVDNEGGIDGIGYDTTHKLFAKISGTSYSIPYANNLEIIFRSKQYTGHCDDAPVGVFYTSASSSSSGMPLNRVYFLITIELGYNSDKWRRQVAFDVNTYSMLTRAKVNGTWNEWKTVSLT